MNRTGCLLVLGLLALAGCKNNKLISPSPNQTFQHDDHPSFTGPLLNASPVAAVPEGARLVALGEPVAAIVSKTDPICYTDDGANEIVDPCQRFYVRAALDGVLALSVTWEPTGDWL